MTAPASNTPYGIIKSAMHDAGYLSEGDDPNSEQLAEYLERLCDIINLWQTGGLKLFLQQEVTVPLTEGQSSYVLSPTGDVVMTKPLRVVQGYVLDTDGNRRPITPMAWEEWMRLSQVTGNNGTITSYFVDKRATSLVINVWNAPDTAEAENSAVFLTHVQATNPVNLLETMAFPQEWRIALRWALADDICTGQPQAIMDRCAQRAAIYKEMLEDFDVEDANVNFIPDLRGGYSNGAFR